MTDNGIKTFKLNNYEYTFNVQRQKKLPYAVVYIKINTNEKELLFSLNMRYKSDKLLQCGINPNNFMYNCIVGINGIILHVPENKIVNNVTNYIKFLSSTQLNSKQLYGSKGSYSNLEKSLNKITIYVTGKCQTFLKNNLLKDSMKIPNMLKSISERNVKEKNEITNDKFESKSFEFEATDEELIDVNVMMESKSCYFTKNNDKYNLYFFDSFEGNYSSSLRGLLKAFKTLSGTIGSNDEKNKEIMKTINFLTFCYTDVRGIGLKYKNLDEIKNINSNSIRIFTNIMKMN